MAHGPGLCGVDKLQTIIEVIVTVAVCLGVGSEVE